MQDQAILDQLIQAVTAAAEHKQALCIRGSGSKDFYGNPQALQLPALNTATWQGIVDYEPSELVVTARAGTPLAELEKLLHDHGQMLAFEPPYFNASATLGGCIAAGLSGPRRAYTGAVRDYVLGIKLLDGQGRILSFGGRVMKNVAGYDVSRLMAGSMGCLGVMTELTVKVLPRPSAEITLLFSCDQGQAIRLLNSWATQPLPISGSFWSDGQLALRLSGAEAAVAAARQGLGGELLPQGVNFWQSVREQTLPAFSGEALWRLALPSKTPPLSHPVQCAIEWGAGLRWIAAHDDGDAGGIRKMAQEAGGHATLFRASEAMRCREGAFAPLSPGLLALHRRLKKVFDPHGIFNPGRMYAEF